MEFHCILQKKISKYLLKSNFFVCTISFTQHIQEIIHLLVKFDNWKILIMYWNKQTTVLKYICNVTKIIFNRKNKKNPTFPRLQEKFPKSHIKDL